jgi:branched-chain amino acid transport system permease protein
MSAPAPGLAVGSLARELRQSLLAAVWFMFLSFPIVVPRINTSGDLVEWRWGNLAYVGVALFFGSWVWRAMMARRDAGAAGKHSAHSTGTEDHIPWHQRWLSEKRTLVPTAAVLVTAALLVPALFNEHQVGLMITALIWVMLGLGLNIVVGVAGLLDLGYVAFYAVGAYGYALLNQYYGLDFWLAIPVCAGLAALFGILLGIPVLRLRGDYLAIVTLGFGEIIRLILENWGEVTHGPSGVKNIPWPTMFGVEISRAEAATFIYYLMLAVVVATIFIINRLQNSRIGRAWVALREDEIACQAMGINRMHTKLAAFASGATWAGVAGVIFAARTGFINPASFTFWESALILCIVVLGGMGSILGVTIAAFIFSLVPETLREVNEYRMLVFGAAMVLMMVFRPQGLIANVRRKYEFHGLDSAGEAN